MSPVDTLDDVLDIAAEVLRDYGGEPGDTRIERLARYVASNLGGEPHTGRLTSYQNPAVDRAVAVGYLRMAESQEDT